MKLIDAETVMQVYEADPKTHAETMRSQRAEGRSKAMLEEIVA